MISQIDEIVNSVEDGVDGLGKVVMHVVGSHFLSLDLLRSNFAIRGEKMQKNCTEISRVLTGGAIK